MDKFLYILDAGHGGINPSTGQYVTPGKRSPYFEDGSILYEGVQNRIKVKKIISLMKEYELRCVDIVDSWKDVSLKERVSRANELHKKNKCIYLSIHSNAYGRGWTSPKGISTHVFGSSKLSNKYGKIFHDELICNFENETKNRRLKHSNFYVLRKTKMPSILFEIGFHSNKEEAKKIMSNKWIDLVAKSIVDSCLIIE